MPIRQATQADIKLLAQLNASVQQLHHAARPHFYKPPDLPALEAVFQETLPNSAFYHFIVEAEGQGVGYAGVREVHRPEDAFAYAVDFILIDQMGVLPEYHGQGYGEALMEAIFELARSKGIVRISLDVWSFNERAITFYHKQGFTSFNNRMELYLKL